MNVSAPEITRTAQGVRYTVQVRDTLRTQPATLWYEVPAEFADFVSTQSDAALVGLLMSAMSTGEPIHLEGRVSRQLLSNLGEAHQSMLRQVVPSLRPVQISATNVTEERHPNAQAVITGYSGGIDSLATLLRPRAADEPTITHLAHHNVGGHGSGAKAAEVFRLRLERARGAARRLGRPLIGVDSNLHDFAGPKTGFMSTHTFCNVSAMLVLQAGVGTYEYSSAHHIRDQVIKDNGDISRIDNLALHLLSTESMKVRLSGENYTRLEKLRLIVEDPIVRDLLDVCIRPREAAGRINCSRCLKCMRAQLSLELLGRLEEFGAVFDLRTYRKMRTLQIAHLLKGQLPPPDEVKNFLLGSGLPIPAWSRFYARPIIFPLAKAWHKLRLRLP